jgi:hypothetical protein
MMRSVYKVGIFAETEVCCRRWATLGVTAEAWHQLGRLVGRDGERDVPAQSPGQAQL